MVLSQTVAIEILNSFFGIVAFPLLDQKSGQDDDVTLVRSSSMTSSGMHLPNLDFWDLQQFWMMLEEPTKDNLSGNGMWTFALGNAMLWWHSAPCC